MIVGGALGGALLLEGVHLLRASEAPIEPGPPEPAHADVLPGAISQEEISGVVSRHKAELRNRCFSPQSELARATVYIDIVVGKSGDVLRSSYEGTDARVTECVDREVRGWRFPAHAEDSRSARIPFFFERT